MKRTSKPKIKTENIGDGKMQTIHQFTYSADNLGYIVFSKSEGVVVDGCNPDYVGAF